MDSQFAPAKSRHQRMRDVREAARRKGLQPASGIAVPCLRKTWIPKEGGIYENEVEAPREVRYTHPIGRKMANGREICAESLLRRYGWRRVFPVHHDRGSQQETVYLCV